MIVFSKRNNLFVGSILAIILVAFLVSCLPAFKGMAGGTRMMTSIYVEKNDYTNNEWLEYSEIVDSDSIDEFKKQYPDTEIANEKFDGIKYDESNHLLTLTNVDLKGANLSLELANGQESITITTHGVCSLGRILCDASVYESGIDETRFIFDGDGVLDVEGFEISGTGGVVNIKDDVTVNVKNTKHNINYYDSDGKTFISENNSYAFAITGVARNDSHSRYIIEGAISPALDFSEHYWIANEEPVDDNDWWFYFSTEPEYTITPSAKDNGAARNGFIQLDNIMLEDLSGNKYEEKHVKIYSDDISEAIDPSFGTDNGISYDKTTNALTLNNVDMSKLGDYSLFINAMGEDFTLKLTGANKLHGLYVVSETNKTRCTVSGPGSLLVDYIKIYNVSKASLHLNSDVTMTLESDITMYEGLNGEDDPVEPSAPFDSFSTDGFIGSDIEYSDVYSTYEHMYEYSIYEKHSDPLYGNYNEILFLPKNSEPTTPSNDSTFPGTPSVPADNPSTPSSVLNYGIQEISNDVWAMFKDGTIDTSYTGIAKNDYGWWRVENGYVNFGATGIYKNEFGWWRVENGKVDFDADGIYKNEFGWWKTTNGKVTFHETGIFKNEYGWWRVEDSKVDFTANGIYRNEHGWWKTTNGKVTFVEDGVFKNEYGWWKVDGSKVDFDFTGIASNQFGIWYVNNGKVDFNKNGTILFEGKTYIIENGKVK